MKDKITEKIINLSKGNKPFVASINGVWGCGKTHYWINDIAKKLKKNKITPIYISLFGKESVVEIETEFSLQVIKYIGNNVLSDEGKALRSGLFKKVRMGLSSILSFLEPEDLSNVIVCFDDFERLSEKIAYRDFIGLLSELKEQKKCKVVLILNSNAINDLDKKRMEEVNTYLEKAVDYEFSYVPSTDDLFEVVNSEIIYMREHLREFMSEVSILNLRTIQKIVCALNDFSFIKDHNYDPRLVERFVFQLMEIAYIYIEHRTFESQYDLTYMGDRALGSLSDDQFKETEKKHNEWKVSFASKKTSRFVSGYDESRVLVQDYLQTSIPNVDATKDYFDRKSKILEIEDMYASFDDCHNRHRFDFNYSTNDYVENIDNLLDSNRGLLKSSVNTLIYNTNILYEYGDEPESYHKRAIGILKEWLSDVAADFTDKYYDSEDLDLVKKFDSELTEFYENVRDKILEDKKTRLNDISMCLKRVNRESNWSTADIELLSKLTHSEVIDYSRISSEFTENAFRFIYKMKETIGVTSIDLAFTAIIRAFKELSENGSDEEKAKASEMLKLI